MGKRKRATKPPPKKKTAKLERIFNCPICNHEQSVECVIERDTNIGQVKCRVCGDEFRTVVNHLEEEVDVFAKWIDALDRVNAQQHEEEKEPVRDRRKIDIQEEDAEAGVRDDDGLGSENDDL